MRRWYCGDVVLRTNVLPLWVRVADGAAVALLCLAVFVAITGGFVIWPAGVRVSVKSEWRLIAWAAALLAFRHVLTRRALRCI